MGKHHLRTSHMTCHMGSHTHATQHKQTHLALTPASKVGTRFIYPRGT